METLSNKELRDKYFEGREWKFKPSLPEITELRIIVDNRFDEMGLTKVDYKRICSCKPMILRKLEALIQNEFVK